MLKDIFPSIVQAIRKIQFAKNFETNFPPDLSHKWGGEIVLVSTPLYCLKVLMILNNKSVSSKHYHAIKDETFLVLQGKLYLEYWLNGDLLPIHSNIPRGLHRYNTKHLTHGQTFNLPPFTPHMFCNLYKDPCIVLEVSTYDDPEDSYRMQDSCWVCEEELIALYRE